MSFFQAQTSAQIIEDHSDEFHSSESSYSAQHPMLVARLAVKSIRKGDHLDNYQEVNPFARAEAGVTNDELVKAALALMKIPGRTGLCMRPVQGTKSRHSGRNQDPLRRCKGSKVFGGSDASFLAMWPSGTMIDDVDLSKDHFWESYSERSHNWGVSHVSAFYFYIMCERMVEGRLTEKEIGFMFSP